MRISGAKFVSGDADTGLLILSRLDGTEARCGVVLMRGVTLTENNDSTFDLTFDGS